MKPRSHLCLPEPSPTSAPPPPPNFSHQRASKPLPPARRHRPQPPSTSAPPPPPTPFHQCPAAAPKPLPLAPRRCPDHPHTSAPWRLRTPSDQRPAAVCASVATAPDSPHPLHRVRQFAGVIDRDNQEDGNRGTWGIPGRSPACQENLYCWIYLERTEGAHLCSSRTFIAKKEKRAVELIEAVMLLHFLVLDEPLRRRFLLSGPDPTIVAIARRLPAKDHHLPDDVPNPADEACRQNPPPSSSCRDEQDPAGA
ncbi:formin-like protein 14 [Triticum aestivum]|uniref:formin-like protein 14 n=1 Tax=Triticum aestivum TaxID=4565 RepID=UPI001ABD0D1B|nr:formin-like protein 14 [Triticum aestivum]